MFPPVLPGELRMVHLTRSSSLQKTKSEKLKYRAFKKFLQVYWKNQKFFQLLPSGEDSRPDMDTTLKAFWRIRAVIGCVLLLSVFLLYFDQFVVGVAEAQFLSVFDLDFVGDVVGDGG